MRVLITGSAGFIGFHLAQRMLAEGHHVLGIDGMTSYYDVALKRARLAQLTAVERYRHVTMMLESPDLLETIAEFDPDVVYHLAAQAGVRYSIENPPAYIQSHIVGTFNVLEACKATRPQHLLIASTSSVYGGNESMPFSEADRTDFPVSLYAATKKSTEVMSHSYAHLHHLPVTCFRFFTVYGPWGRPDMALFKFVERIDRGDPIDVYGEGQMRRDFTYVDDLVEGVVRLTGAVPREDRRIRQGAVDSLSPVAPWRAVNIAAGNPVGLLPFVETIESALGRSADRNMLPMQPGDVTETFADPRLLRALTGFSPTTSVDTGVKEFIKWHREYRYDLAR